MGMIGVLLGLLLLLTHRFPAAPGLGNAFLWMGGSFLFTCLVMLWGSKFGKLRYANRVVRSLALRGDEQVLDVGCGHGLMLITAASLLLAISHYRGPQILRHVEERTQTGARSFPGKPADEFVPVVVGLVSVTLGIVTGCLVYRMRADRGIYVVFLLASLAVLGLVVAWSLPIRPLAETKLQHLRVEQLIPTSLLGLCSLLPLGSALGWYAKFASTEA